MGKSTPQAPPPPDPRVVAQAQSQANIESATAQQKLNMIGTRGPQGSVSYVADPSQPGGYTQETSLSPAEQAIYDAQKKTELGATNIAYDQLGRVQGALQTPLNTQGLPELQGGVNAGQIATSFNPGGAVQTQVAGAGGIQNSFDKGQALQYQFNPGQQVQGSVGGDLEAARRNAENAVYQQAASRLDPRFSQDENALRTKLANQGLSQNSDAYQTALQNFSQGKNDAYNQAQYSAIQAGEQAAQGQFGRQLAQGQFANDAAGQMYAQNMGQAAFHNQTAGQDYSQNKGAAEFSNTAQQQQFAQNLAKFQAENAAQQQQYGQNLTGAEFGNQAQNQQFNQGVANAQLSNTARQQGLNERAYIQNAPINQLTGLLGLGQVGMPTGVNYTPSQVGQTDVTGAYALNQQAQNANYQARMQQQSGLMGGLFSLGSAAIMASDGRLKTDKRLLRIRPDGIEVWAFRYLTDEPGMVRIGVMAQQVKKRRPDLVVRRSDGFLAVNYAGLEAA